MATLRECLRQINNKNDIGSIANMICEVFLSRSFEKYDIKKVNTETEKQIKSLLRLPKSKPDYEPIVVVKALEFEPTAKFGSIEFYTTYDCFLLNKNITDKNHYSLADSDWATIIDTPILDNSIHLYGLIDVLSTILNELSWFGSDYQTSKKNIDKFHKQIELSLKEVEENQETAVPYDSDEFRKRLGLEPKSEEQKIHEEQQRKIINKTILEYYDAQIELLFSERNIQKING